MDGKQQRRIENDRPIAKPNVPLPTIFNRGVKSESPTLKRQPERAYFYRKQSDRSGASTYGFFITTEPVERETRT
jgi:hypothetical protein